MNPEEFPHACAAEDYCMLDQACESYWACFELPPWEDDDYSYDAYGEVL